LAVIVGSTAGVSNSSGQTLLSSFENDLSSSLGVDWAVWDTFDYSFTDIGATDGTSALAIHHPTSGSWQIQGFFDGGVPLAQLAADNGFMQVDVTTTDVGEAGDGLSPSWRQVYLIFNSNQGGWQQTAFGLTVAADDGGSSTQTLTLDLASSGIQANAAAYAASGGGDGTWWQLFIALQGDDVGQLKPGDYNNNTIVDAADYTTWRDTLGATTLTNETASPGIVDSADYDEWKANFGSDYRVTTIFDNFRFLNAGSGSIVSGAVPEPASAGFVSVAVAAGLACLRKRRRN
jgi:hypothetical protein